ncbi:MAG TPA: ABC transporter permease [Terriglobales bacterium]|nr:ABC transporter permease [Terriglobales bacterium]
MSSKFRFLSDRLFHRDRLDLEMNEEIEFHIGQRASELEKSGLSKAEALRCARLEFGGIEKYSERCRETRRFHLLHDFVADLRYGLRTLRNAPGFTTVAVLTLALGIGANSAIFSVVHSVLLKPLPVRDAESLRLLDWSKAPAWEFPNALQVDMDGHQSRDSAGREVLESFSLAAFRKFSQSGIFSSLFGFSFPQKVNVGGSMTFGQLVSGNFFRDLDVRPATGRLFDDDDDRPESELVAVISCEFWRGHFDSDPNIIGRKLLVNDHPLTIVGVVPRDFFGVQPGVPIDVYAPLRAEGELNTMGEPAPAPGQPSLYLRPNTFWVQMMGRIAPGQTDVQAQAKLNGLFRQELSAMGVTNQDNARSPRIDLRSGNRGLDELNEEFSRPLLILGCVVALVLLIACGNVANLLLMRGAARSREMAVRLSLGAGRTRIVRQLLTESLLLALTGAALGLIFALWTSRLLVRLLSPPQTRFTIAAHLDGSVVAFSALIAVVTSIAFGLIPAFRSGGVELTSALKTSGSSTLAKPESRLSKGLVAAQVALSVLLLVGAGLFVRTLENLRGTNLGFDSHNLLLFSVDPSLSGYHGQRLTNLLDEITARLQLVPGVRAVAFTHHTPVSEDMSGGVVNSDLPGKRQDVDSMYNVVGADYFRVMGMRLLQGRTFDAQDSPTSTKVAVINQQLATKLFGSQSPLGHTVHKDPRWTMYKEDCQIIGVVNDAIYADLKHSDATLYTFYRQAPETFIREPGFMIRTWNNPHNVVADVRRAIAQIDPNLPIYGIRTETEQIDLTLRQQFLFAELTSLFGVLALLLASVGLYGIMAYSVTRRTREIGIRVALGADRRSLRAMVLRESMLLVGCGVVIGIPLAIGLSRLIHSLLWNVQPFDPQTLIGVALLMGVLAIAATSIPARRATRVDPLEALRCE